MIKIKGNLLVFDKADRNYRIFPKECKVSTPSVVPLVWQDRVNDPESVLGAINVITRNENGISIEGYLNDTPSGLVANDLIKNQDLYFGGYYKVEKMHKEKGLLVYDVLDLRSVGLYLDDQYDDKSLKVEILEEESC